MYRIVIFGTTYRQWLYFKIMKCLLIVVFVCILIEHCAFALEMRVTKVIDGDTIDAVSLGSRSKRYRVRLFGIDSPEEGKVMAMKPQRN